MTVSADPLTAHDSPGTPKSPGRTLSPQLTAAIAAGLLIGLVFTIINALHSTGPTVTPYQPDSLIYYQYGRAIAEGHPYRFTADQDPSTGSTSHLYPAVLGLLHAAGATGERLAFASFLLGAVSLCFTLACMVWIVRVLRPEAGWLTLALCALSGQLVLSCLGESDISLFTPLALGALAAALHGRVRTLAALLFAAAFCRPEGMILSALLLAGAGGWLLLRRPGTWVRGFAVAGAVGMLGAGLAFALNLALTGSVGFQSVHLKGHFAEFPLAGALTLTTRDVSNLVMELFWGVNRGFRSMYLLPVVGGLLALIGVLSRNWEWTRSRFCEAWVLLASAAALCLVASSGWEGLVFDRYFAWWLPMLLLYVAIGVHTISERVSREAAWGLATLLIGYQAMALVFFAGAFASENLGLAPRIDFVRQTHAQLPPEARVGMVNSAGLAYYLPGRSVVNVSGIESPPFIPRKHIVESVERLKHEPERRFDFWLLPNSVASQGYFAPLVGEVLAEEVMARDPDSAFGVYRTDWSLLERGQTPTKPEAIQAVAGMVLVDSLDVGYAPDEERHAREVYIRLAAKKLAPFLTEAESAGQSILEVGEAVVGSETFNISATPNRPVRLIMRTLPEVEVTVAGADGSRKTHTYRLSNPLRLLVQGAGLQSEIQSYALTTESNHFDEIVIDIPAEMITAEISRITIGGDHVSCAFWTYQ